MLAISKVLDRFDEVGPILVYATHGLTPEQAQATPGPGAWSIAELVAHLLDTELVLSDRAKRLIAEENPVLQAFDENAWIRRLDSKSMPVEEAVNLFVANHRWMSRLLRKCKEEDFARSGQHSEGSRLTLAEVVAKMVGHVDHHLRFLYAKRANLGISQLPRYAND